MSSIMTASLAFVSVLGGLSVLLLTPANITNIALTFAVFLIMTPIGFYAYKNIRPLKATKAVISFLCTVSSAVTLTVSAELITASDILDKDFYPLVILLTGFLAVAVAVSENSAQKRVSVIISVLTVVVLLVIISLSLLDTDFVLPKPAKIDFFGFFPFGILAVFDIFLIFPVSDSRSFVPFLIGGGIAFLLMLIIVFIAMLILPPPVYYAFDMPLLKVWQSTFIPSFINRFEVFALTFIYGICAVKSGLLLAPTLKFIGKKHFFLALSLLFSLTALFSFL